MKKLLGMALLGIIAVGCGGGSKEAKPTPPPAATDPNAGTQMAPPPGAPPAQ